MEHESGDEYEVSLEELEQRRLNELIEVEEEIYEILYTRIPRADR